MSNEVGKHINGGDSRICKEPINLTNKVGWLEEEVRDHPNNKAEAIYKVNCIEDP